MENGITGKVIIITGASSGIGRATALLLAERGAKLVLGARRLEPLSALAASIMAAGGEAAFIATDVSRRPDVAALELLPPERFGPWFDRFLPDLTASRPAPGAFAPTGMRPAAR